MTKIALDVESTLANSNEAALQSTGKLDREKLIGEWDLDDYTWQVYMGVTDALWRHKPAVIPPEEPDLDRHVASIADGNELDILTARRHVDPQIKWWLDHHGIEYDTFISTEKDKCTFEEYDVFIDDNPEMVGECRQLLLRHQPWNAHIDTSRYKSVHRIYSLAQVEPFV